MTISLLIYYKQNSNALRAYYFVFEVLNTFFYYDLVLISLNDKIIRYNYKIKCFYSILII